MAMEVKVIYVHHSCFLLETDEEVFLFDYPPESHLSSGAKEIVLDEIRGSVLNVFISHSHPDHFTSGIDEFSRYAERVNYVLSPDVYALRNSMDLEGDVIEAEPGGEYPLNGYDIKAFKSNDAGVAYLVQSDDMTLYYGGDLAKWDWEEWSEDKRRSKVKVFKDILEVLRKKGVDIGFSNMDERLESWAGAVEFIETVSPRYFVPIHTFGNEAWVDDLMEELGGEEHPDIFNYENPGDKVVWRF